MSSDWNDLFKGFNRQMNWHTYLMGFAEHAATKSKDSTKVGAVLVGTENDVRLSSYNGPPIGVQDLPERFERPAKYLFASHAEANIISFAARQGIRTEGCTLYVTHHPCAACARSIIQAGIRCVVYGPGEFKALEDERGAADAMFREAGVTLVRFERKTVQFDGTVTREQVERLAIRDVKSRSTWSDETPEQGIPAEKEIT